MLKETMGARKDRNGGRSHAHPAPLALLGIGAGWLVVSVARSTSWRGESGGSVRDRVSGAIRDASRRTRDLAGRLRERVGARAESAGAATPPTFYPAPAAPQAEEHRSADEEMHQATELKAAAQGRLQNVARRVREAGNAAWKQARDYAGRAGERIHDAGEGARKIVDDRPLVVCAFGFFAGVAVALLLADRNAKERARELAGERALGPRAAAGRRMRDRRQKVDVAMGATL